MHKLVHKRTAAGVVEIRTDGRTVWVNAANGSLIGRLSVRGIDVHSKAEDTHCLDCSQVENAKAWAHFTASMLQHHSIAVPKSYCPSWARVKQT